MRASGRIERARLEARSDHTPAGYSHASTAVLAHNAEVCSPNLYHCTGAAILTALANTPIDWPRVTGEDHVQAEISDLDLAGGASAARQYLARGLVDEMA